MSDTASAQREPIAVEYLDPATLLVDANIRTDASLDADFVASIKERWDRNTAERGRDLILRT
jgi:hypothetical protein